MSAPRDPAPDARILNNRAATTMTASTPTPHEAATLAETRADNAQDDARARELVQSLAADTQTRQRIADNARQAADANAALLRQTLGQHTAVLETGPGISPREAAVYILASLSAGTSAATARRVVRERLEILQEVAPLKPVEP